MGEPEPITVHIVEDEPNTRMVDGNRVLVGSNDWMDTGVYRLRFQDGSCYIGSSLRASKRVASHIFFLRKGKHYSRLVQAAWDKYGDVSCEMVLVCRKSDLLFYEQLCLDGLAPELNLNIAARASIRPTEATRLKMSISMKGKNTKPRTPEWKEKISKTLLERGRKETRPPEVRDKIGKKSQERWDKTSPEERLRIMKKAWETRRSRQGKLDG